MGDVIRPFLVRSGARGKRLRLRLYFDSGSPYTFIKRSVADRLGHPFKLPAPQAFLGMGNGRFRTASAIYVEFRFLTVWCPHFAFVIADDLLSPAEDMLVGHDLMQRVNIQLLPKRRDVRFDRDALKRALLVRRAGRLHWPVESTGTGAA